MPSVSRVKQRSYDNSRRIAAANSRRKQTLRAAQQLFAARGYAGTTMRDIAGAAGVSVKTVEASLRTKPNILKLLVDIAIAGDDQPVALIDRPIIHRMREAADLEELAALYATLVAEISARLGPISRVVDEAAGIDPDIARLQRTMRENRLFGARHVALMFAAVVEPDRIDVDATADVLFLFNDPTIYDVLVRQRGWTTETFQTWLAANYRRQIEPV